MAAKKETEKGPGRQSSRASSVVAGSFQKRNATVERLKSGKSSKANVRSVPQGNFEDVLRYIQSMTADEFRESFRAVGIIDKSGKLTKPYRS